MKEALESKNETLSDLENAFVQSKTKMDKKYKEMELVLKEKDEFVSQLSQSNDLKNQEIEKIEELIENYKEVIKHQTEERKYL